MRFTGFAALTLAGSAMAVPVFVDPNTPFSKPAEAGFSGVSYKILPYEPTSTSSIATPTPNPIVSTPTAMPTATRGATPDGHPDESLSEEREQFFKDYKHWISLPHNADRQREHWEKEVLEDLKNLAHIGQEKERPTATSSHTRFTPFASVTRSPEA